MCKPHKHYYEILGLKIGASLDEVKEAYKDLVKVWHPDRFTNEPKLQLKAQEKLKEINEAYQMIQNSLINTYETTCVAEQENQTHEESKEKEDRGYSYQPSSPPQEVTFANFSERVTDYFFDIPILFLIAKFIGVGTETEALMIFSSFFVIYHAVMESSNIQGTLGKMAIKIKVTDINGNRLSFIKASLRAFGKIISIFTLGIGFLPILFTKNRQALHDIIAGTLVVNKNKSLLSD
ncbi:MAG: RDD family protein [Nitrospinae bacterium]|nr:RDD family protein [Nitrospinota bacterium]